MARPMRILYAGAWYHVMNRGANHQCIFFDEQDRYVFLKILKKVVGIYGVEVHCYCLMTNHYHLVLHTPRGNLSDVMRQLNSSYTQYINLRNKRDGSLFRGRYKAIVIGADDYLLNVSRYIHLNPKDIKQIKNLSQYKWSSYPCYLGMAKTPSWLILEEVKNRFGVGDFKLRYKKYVEEGIDDEIQEFYQAGNLVLGKEDFCKYIFEHARVHSLSAEVVGRDRIIEPLSMEIIIGVVSEHFQVDSKSIKRRFNLKRRNVARNVAIYLCRVVGGHSLREIGEFMGGIRYVSVSNVVRAVKVEPKLMEVVKLLSDQLGRELSEFKLELNVEQKT